MRQSMLILGGSIIIIGSLLVKVVVAQHDGILTEDLYENEHVVPAHEHYQYTTPPCCKNPTVEAANYVVLSTMDGRLVALDVANGGKTVWETGTDGSPLLSGTLGRMQPISADGRHFSLIPALDGSLYMYSQDDRLLESIPLNTDLLLQASVRIGHDAVAGGKTVSTTGIDPLTGQIRYHCSSAMCDSNETGVASSTLVFRRSTNAVRAVDALTGTERWNLSVSEYDASLVLDHTADLSSTVAKSRIRFLVQPPEGIVTAIDSCGNQLWSCQLDSHIAKTWRMESAELTEVSLFDSQNIHTLATMDDRQESDVLNGEESLFYIGTLNNEPFIMHSIKAKNELKRLARNNQDFSETTHTPGTQLVKSPQNMFFVQDRTIDDLLSVSFRNTYSSKQREVGNRQVAIPRSKNMQVVNRERRDSYSASSCPNGDGISLIGDKYIKNAAFDKGVTNGNQGWFVMQPPTTSARPRLIGMKPAQCAAHFMKKVEEKLDTWWKMTLGLLSVVFVTGLVTVGLLRTKKRKATINVNITTTVARIADRKSAETRSTSCGPSVNGGTDTTSTAPPSPPTTITRERRTTSSNNSSCDPFHSKFLMDFEPVKLLGHGGFGVVFKAKNRLDEGFYAVKRIAVANNEVAIQRVLREVRAMARLDHHGIIRYYHTWIEKPPQGWQEETDRGMLAGIKSKRKQLNVGKEKEVVKDDPPSMVTTASESSAMLPPSILPSDDSGGSWLEDTNGANKASSDLDSSSDESDTESDSYGTEPIDPKPIADNSISIVFGSDHSKTSKSSKEISQLGTQMVLVTSVDEDVLPSTTTHNYVYLYIQMQLCQERTLHSWLSHHAMPADRPLGKMKQWLDQMTSAVNYIHGQGLIHRDIKPQNIFFSADDNLKIGDLGLVTKCVSAEEQPIEKSNRRSSSIHTDNVGTRGYMSPEQLENLPYTYKVDVFSLGLIFCELVVPFQTLMERSRTLGDLQRGVEPEVLAKCAAAEREMVKWLTHLDPEQRPSCEQILHSDYLMDCYQMEAESASPVARRRFRSERLS